MLTIDRKVAILLLAVLLFPVRVIVTVAPSVLVAVREHLLTPLLAPLLITSPKVLVLMTSVLSLVIGLNGYIEMANAELRLVFV